MSHDKGAAMTGKMRKESMFAWDPVLIETLALLREAISAYEGGTDAERLKLVARQCATSPNTLKRWLTGEVNGPAFRTIRRVLARLGYDLRVVPNISGNIQKKIMEYN